MSDEQQAPERDPLVKKFAYEWVCFNHDVNDKYPYLVTDITDDCMIELEGMSGLFAPSCFHLVPAPPTPGADGRYCRHHDDDPAHTKECYKPPVAQPPDTATIEDAAKAVYRKYGANLAAFWRDAFAAEAQKHGDPVERYGVDGNCIHCLPVCRACQLNTIEAHLKEIAAAQQRGSELQREVDAKIAESAFEEFQTGYNAGKWIAAAIRAAKQQ